MYLLLAEMLAHLLWDMLLTRNVDALQLRKSDHAYFARLYWMVC